MYIEFEIAGDIDGEDYNYLLNYTLSEPIVEILGVLSKEGYGFRELMEALRWHSRRDDIEQELSDLRAEVKSLKAAPSSLTGEVLEILKEQQKALDAFKEMKLSISQPPVDTKPEPEVVSADEPIVESPSPVATPALVSALLADEDDDGDDDETEDITVPEPEKPVERRGLLRKNKMRR